MAQVGIVGFCLVLLIGIVVAHVNSDPSAANANASPSSTPDPSASSNPDPMPSMPLPLLFGFGGGGLGGGPKEFMKSGLNSAVQHIVEQVKQSPVFINAEKDPQTKQAHAVCVSVLDRATKDLQRSIERTNLFDFDFDDLDDRLFDLKVWLSSASKGQNTCSDAFEKTTGDAADQMKELLRVSKELTITGFNMIDKLYNLLQGLQLQGTNPRKLLQVPLPPDQVPAWAKPAWKDILKGDGAKSKAHAVVAADGSGKFKTVSEAVKSIPADNPDLYIIYIKSGVYNENVVIQASQPNVALIGDGPAKTIITGSRSEKSGYNTLQSATVGVEGFNFLAKDIGFENTAKADEGPAVALRIAADKSVVVNCHMSGNQDTLFAQVYRQFYRDCAIAGTIDFVFGGGIAIFQSCQVMARKPASGQANMLVAQNREFDNDISGIILDNCALSPEHDLAADPSIQSFLGRPWKPYSRMIIMNSNIENFINASGWDIWLPDKPNTENSFIAEYNNKGPGADVSKRVTWPSIKKISSDEANGFTPTTFLKGDSWIPATGVSCTSSGPPSSLTDSLFSGSSSAPSGSPSSDAPSEAPSDASSDAPSSSPSKSSGAPSEAPSDSSSDDPSSSPSKSSDAPSSSPSKSSGSPSKSSGASSSS